MEKGFNTDRLQIRIKEKRFPFDYIEVERMKRDGWIWSTQKEMNLNSADIQYSKLLNKKTKIINIGKKKTNYGHSENPYNWNTFIEGKQGVIEIENYESIDSNKDGRILMSKNGCIYACKDYTDFINPDKIELIKDLNGNEPYEMVAPEEMKIW